MRRRNKEENYIDEKMEKQKKFVFAAKDRYEAELEELTHLQKKKRELEGKELLKAFENSYAGENQPRSAKNGIISHLLAFLSARIALVSAAISFNNISVQSASTQIQNRINCPIYLQ